MKSSKQLKIELFSIDTEYIAGCMSASEYSIKVEELMEAIELAEQAERLVQMWKEDSLYMNAHI